MPGAMCCPASPLARARPPCRASSSKPPWNRIAYWFQNRDRCGLTRIWEYHGTYRDIADLDLLSSVRAVLFQFTRWET